jgi:hypothetical protein
LSNLFLKYKTNIPDVSNLSMQIIKEHLNIISAAEQEISFDAGTDIVVFLKH